MVLVSMIQQEKLEENDQRRLISEASGELKGNNDLLSLTRPDVIEKIHSSYFEAGMTSWKQIPSVQRVLQWRIIIWRTSLTI